MNWLKGLNNSFSFEAINNFRDSGPLRERLSRLTNRQTESNNCITAYASL